MVIFSVSSGPYSDIGWAYGTVVHNTMGEVYGGHLPKFFGLILVVGGSLGFGDPEHGWKSCGIV